MLPSAYRRMAGSTVGKLWAEAPVSACKNQCVQSPGAGGREVNGETGQQQGVQQNIDVVLSPLTGALSEFDREVGLQVLALINYLSRLWN